MRSRYRLNRSALTATGQLSLGQVQVGTPISIQLIHFRSCSTEPRALAASRFFEANRGAAAIPQTCSTNRTTMRHVAFDVSPLRPYPVPLTSAARTTCRYKVKSFSEKQFRAIVFDR